MEIARSLVISPSFILLDEPFSGIDPLTVIDIQKIIVRLKESGIGVLVTDHNVRETLQVTDRAYIINNGRIFRAGSPDGTRQRSGGQTGLLGRLVSTGNVKEQVRCPVSEVRGAEFEVRRSSLERLRTSDAGHRTVF